jgi:hypothetical protein
MSVSGQRKQKTITLPRGIFVLRYESASDSSAPPTVSVICDPGKNAAILHPDATDAVLKKPGTGLVLQARSEGSVILEIFSEFPNGSLEATLKCEAVNQALESSQGKSPRAEVIYQPKEAAQLVSYEISILGHVARLGDVVVSANEWLAGPSAPSRIEGLEVRWPGKPRDAVLSYGVRLPGDKLDSFRSSDINVFTGSRGRALPVIGGYFELSGPVAKTHRLVVESLFLSGTPRRQFGDVVKISGPTGHEPLVGIRLQIEKLNVFPAAAETPQRRVRVFRAN